MKRIEFVSLEVRDLEKSKRFYTTQLGFKVLENGSADAVVFMNNDGQPFFAIKKPFGDIEGKELDIGVSLWFAIDKNIENLKEDYERKNITILGTINQTPFGKSMMVKDPDRYVITFIEPNH